MIKLYQHQEKGKELLLKHKKYCLFFEVGTGKTFTALAVIKYYELRNDRVLVLVPKKLRDNWTIYTQNDKRNIFVDDRFTFSGHLNKSVRRGYPTKTQGRTKFHPVGSGLLRIQRTLQRPAAYLKFHILHTAKLINLGAERQKKPPNFLSGFVPLNIKLLDCKIIFYLPKLKLIHKCHMSVFRFRQKLNFVKVFTVG